MKFAFILLSLCVTFVHVYAQDTYNADLIPASLKNRANAIIRNEETTVNMLAIDNVTQTVKQAITVLNKNGENAARLVLFYDKSITIKSLKGEVYNAAGKLTGKFNQSNFTDESAADGFSLFVDNRVKHFLPNESVYPYTVVYNYEIKHKQNLVIPDWNPKPANDVSVEQSSYTFICNLMDELRIKAQNYPGNPLETKTDKQKTYVWAVKNIAAVKPEPYSPDRDTYETSVKIAPKDFAFYNYKGTYNNWDELGKWIYSNLLKGRSALPQGTIEAIKDLVKNDIDDKDKARKIYQYMQNKTRYISVQIGIGGNQPVAASEVDRLGYGDCKALVNYTQSLLSVAGIESYYCVVEAGSRKKSFDANYASMVQGNHIILCMPLKGDTTWLECTNQKIPFGFLSDFTDDRLVLACTANGGKLLKTPKLSTQENKQHRTANLSILPNGDVKGNIKTIFSGAQYDNSEHIIGKSFPEQQKLLADAYNIDNINFNKITYIQNKSLAPQITEELDVSINKYAFVNNDKLFLIPNAFNIKESIAETKTRTKSLYLDRGFTDEDSITYNLPDGLLTTAIPNNDKKIKNQFGEYITKVTLEGKKLNYYRKLVINEGTFPPDAYAEFYNFITEVYTADRYKLILSLKR
ncbi:DUF3857 domain-containing protein [Pedobacter aquatilis]|uniref:DUF3857 domain-containing protein n=1 Tax=Pedobacter aquatilis TaxID=351343 RepID=UPI0025B51F93|nr:DUF3857 domain-containing protein [Pedobacter aquatilis]MDN3585792.1 DUF3857 domain-containing protein [Pedobacter aquatilis]